jgi:ribose 5-phosphate isomerase B
MIYIGSDHRGFELKNKIKKFLEELGYEFEDLGAFEYNKGDDYPDFAQAVAKKVFVDSGSRGILICGSGIGIAIAANKTKGIRAGTALKPDQARAAVNDEDLNILALSADFLKEDEVREIVKVFLETKFSGEERHKRRIEKIDL